MAHEKDLQKKKVRRCNQDASQSNPIDLYKKYSEKIEKIINNFCTSASYLPPTTFGQSQVDLSQNSLKYGRSSAFDLTCSNLTGLECAIPDLESLLRNNLSGEKRERKKSKLMKVCVDHTWSAMNELEH